MRPEFAVELDRVGPGGDSARYAAWLGVWLANSQAARRKSGSYGNGDGFGNGDGNVGGGGFGSADSFRLGDGYGVDGGFDDDAWNVSDGDGDGNGSGWGKVFWRADAP